jgi:lantibiotic modifying enzyme
MNVTAGEIVPVTTRAACTRVPWLPLLEGAAADRAVGTAREIGAALAPYGTSGEPLGPWLAGGTAGLAIFYTVLAEVTGDTAMTDLALAVVEETIDRVGTAEQVTPGLYGGLAGVGWALSRLEGRLLDIDEDGSDVDDLVTDLLQHPGAWTGGFDLINGLTGLGVYALERLPRPSARRQLTLVLARLAELAEVEPSSPGRAWRTAPSPLFPPTAMRYPDGHFDIGVAHGVAGPVCFLADVLLLVPDAVEARPLLDDAVRWMRAQRLVGSDSCYPAMLGPGDPLTGTRMAWCYGDPGVAVALLAAGRALADDDLVAEAAEVAHTCAGRDAESGRIQDAGLCHGSAGLGHTLSCLGQDLGDERILDLARSWFSYTFDHRRHGEEIAGFPAIQRRIGPGLDGASGHVPMPGILDGVAGVGLALLAAASSTEPWWDGLLLTRAGASGGGR